MSHRIGQTPLFAAVMEGHVECVRLLFDAGANPAKKNLRGAIPNIIALHRRVLLHVINLVCLLFVSRGIALPEISLLKTALT